MKSILSLLTLPLFLLSSILVHPCHASKNIVVLSDGTGMEIAGYDKNSNVLRLYRMLQQDKQQLVLYDPGIGTSGELNPWAQLRMQLQRTFGLATGWGLDENVLQSYKFLMHNYQDGDHIYLLGFLKL